MSVLLANNVDLKSLMEQKFETYTVEETDDLIYTATAGLLGDVLRRGKSLVGQETPETVKTEEAPKTETRTTRTTRVDRTRDPVDVGGDEEPAKSTEEPKRARVGFKRTNTDDIKDLGYDEETTAFIESYRNALYAAKKYKVNINGDEKALPGIPVYSEMPRARTFTESIQKESAILEGFGSGYHNPPSLYDKNGNLIISDKPRPLSYWRTSDYYIFSGGKFVKDAAKSVRFNKVELHTKDGYPPFFINRGKDLYLVPFKARDTAPAVNLKYKKGEKGDTTGATPTSTPPIHRERTPRPPRTESTPAPAPDSTPSRREPVNTFTPNVDIGSFNWEDVDVSGDIKPASTRLSTPVDVEPSPIIAPAPERTRTKLSEDVDVGPSLKYDPKYQGPSAEIGDKVIVKVLESILAKKSMDVKDIIELAMESTDDAHLQRLLECIVDRLDGASPKDYIRSVERSINGFFHLKFSR